jgi:hypothetical protein
MRVNNWVIGEGDRLMEIARGTIAPPIRSFSN